MNKASVSQDARGPSTRLRAFIRSFVAMLEATLHDDLLSSTGMGDAAEMAARFDSDIRSVDFWRASLGVIQADIDRFESAVDQWQGTS